MFRRSRCSLRLSAVATLALAWGVACSAPPDPAVLRDGGGVWLPANSTPAELGLDRAAVQRLDDLGVRHWFADAGLLLAGGQVQGQIGRLPEGAGDVHLIFRLTDGSLLESSVQATADTLRARALDVQNRGLRVAGVLLDASDGILWSESVWDSLQEIRGAQSELVVGLRPPATIDPQLASEWTHRAFDYLAIDVYGQAFETPEDDTLWEIDRASRLMRDWHAADVPVLPIVWLSGRAQIEVRRGEGSRLRSSASFPRQLIAEHSAQASSGFAFEGFDRQQLALDLPRRTEVRIGGASGHLPAGSRVAISRPTRTHLERLLDGLASALPAVEDEGLHGQSGGRPAMLYAGLAVPEDGLGLSVEDLGASLAEAPGEAPELDLEVDFEPRRGSLTLALRNAGESTGVGVLQHNYVEVRLEGATIRRLEPGQFSRYRLAEKEFADDSARGPARLPRSPRVARIYHPLIERDQVLGDARLELSGRAEAVTIEARFRDATGGDVVATWVWPEPPEEPSTPDGADPAPGRAAKDSEAGR